MLKDLILRSRLCGTGIITQRGSVVHFRVIKMIWQK